MRVLIARIAAGTDTFTHISAGRAAFEATPGRCSPDSPGWRPRCDGRDIVGGIFDAQPGGVAVAE